MVVKKGRLKWLGMLSVKMMPTGSTLYDNGGWWNKIEGSSEVGLYKGGYEEFGPTSRRCTVL